MSIMSEKRYQIIPIAERSEQTEKRLSHAQSGPLFACNYVTI